MNKRAPGGGRKPKPHGLKVLQGTAKPGDEPAVEFPVAASDAPPYWMTNDHAVREWDVLFPLLSTTRIMTAAYRSKLALLCMALAEVVQLYELHRFPSASQLARLSSLYSDFGLDPVSCGRVKPVGKAESSNPFAGLKAG